MRLLRTAPAVVLVLLPLTGCTDQEAAAESAADDLATALASGDVEPVVGAEAQRSYTAATEGLGELEPEVEVGEVERDGDSATATLTWTWPFAAGEWSYDAEAELTRDGDEWRPQWSPAVVEPSLTDDEVLVAQTLTAERAPILGAGGRALVRPRPVTRFGLDKVGLPPAQVERSARRVAQALDIDVAPYVKLAEQMGPRAFVEGIVLRRDDAQQVPPSFSDIRGAAAVDDELPLAPTREFAALILGRVGPVTAEIVEDSDGRYRAGDEAGLSGLQLRYDEQLAGEPGYAVQAVPGDGQGEERTLVEQEPTPGEPLRLTMDERVQRVAEDALSSLPGSAGETALVALRPSDGSVLAAANGAGNALNVATYGRYAPGSTFKVVSALALLRAGATPGTRVPCPRSTVVDGKSFENYSDYPADAYGDIPLATALAQSCNTSFVGARSELQRGDLAEAAEALGLGQDFDLGFPAYFGQVPPPQSETEAAADMIGQGRVQASPLTMASVAASVAAGRTVVPHLIDGYAPDAEPAAPLEKAEAGKLRAMMRGVVERGSGRVLAGLGPVGAKTGTAEYGDPGPGGSLPTHAWMIAFRGDLAVAVFAEDGQSGSTTAGPVLADFLRRVR